ncbi:MAG TPA: hypothetical protein ENN77_02850, partial [Candidatus Wirthbacteria bacterium]|nr:hypothetical protein [Candidatus Wirthbacteria bacterium]
MTQTKTDDKTYSQILRSFGFADDQIQDSLLIIKDILQNDVFKEIMNTLSESDLTILNKLKTQASINHFLDTKIPGFSEKIAQKSESLKAEIESKLLQ